jgi:anti-sigma factor RsiW
MVKERGSVSCRELADFIADYLSGELPVDVRAQFDHHLQVCPNCMKYLDGYRVAMALGKAAFDGRDEAVPADMPDDLVKAILAARR